MTIRRLLLLLAFSLAPAEAAAQARLFPYTATYATTAQFEGRAMDIGVRRITVSDTAIGGHHAWVVAQVTEITHDPLRDPTDSVVMTSGLRPLTRRTKLAACWSPRPRPTRAGRANRPNRNRPPSCCLRRRS